MKPSFGLCKGRLPISARGEVNTTPTLLTKRLSEEGSPGIVAVLK
jgi:hypothetical protein